MTAADRMRAADLKLHGAARDLAGIYGAVAHERVRAHIKHAETSMEAREPHDPTRERILVEEVGEIAKVYNDADATGAAYDSREVLEELYAEVLQTAAMATAWADALAEQLGHHHPHTRLVRVREALLDTTIESTRIRNVNAIAILEEPPL